MRIDCKRRSRQCHQIITLGTEEYPDPARPSITELEVLVTMILDGMRNERMSGKFSDPRRRPYRPAKTNHIIPVSDLHTP